MPSLVEKLPNWLPGTYFKKLAKKWFDHLREFTDTPFQLVKEQMISSAAEYPGMIQLIQVTTFYAAGTAIPSFTSTTLADGDLSLEDERVVKLASMSIYAAGSDSVGVCI